MDITSNKPMSKQELGALKDIEIFSKLAKITSLTSLDQLIDSVVIETPEIIGATSCSIYLIPDFVPHYRGILFRDGVILSGNEIEEDFVVLAATNNEKYREYIGKAYYHRNEGITGWVFGHGLALRIANIANKSEFKTISPDLNWADDYDEKLDDTIQDGLNSILAVPLIKDDQSFGVIKYYAPAKPDSFSSLAEKTAVAVSQIVSATIHNAWTQIEQRNTISRLIEIGQKREIKDVLREVTLSLLRMLRCEMSQVYINFDETSLKLAARNGNVVTDEQYYKLDQGLISWVYKTGKPLIIDDTKMFVKEQLLSDDILNRISDGRELSEKYHFLQSDTLLSPEDSNYPTTFIGVPVWQGSEVFAVLSVQAKYGSLLKRKAPFNRNDLELCKSFSSTISLTVDYDRERNLGNLLTELGYKSDLIDLFDLIIENISKLVLLAHCNIFAYKTTVLEKILELTRTNRKGFLKQGSVLPIYKLGEGKTGFSALTQETLIINHFGSSFTSEGMMEREIERISTRHKNDLISRLVNKDGLQVGIVQLRHGKHILEKYQKLFTELSRSTIVDHGLPLTVKGFLESKFDAPEWSFVAVPIKNEQELFGIITISRSIPERPFSNEDITLLESIAGRLATVINNLRLQEQRKDLMMTLAHEINTPLTGIMAESENLVNALDDNKKLQNLAKQNLEQVLRLNLLTETIMGVLSEKKFNRGYSTVNIGSILRNACALFTAEATFKGIRIQEPKAVDGGFPDLEVFEFDLLNAFKNIIHNAVKYSFMPSKERENSRQIKVWGVWGDFERKTYKINIQNYGVGISQEEIEKRLIFEPYYRGEKANDRRRTGAGFGLAYARKVIEEMHNGFIDVSCVQQGGDAYLTTFTIILPVHHKYE